MMKPVETHNSEQFYVNLDTPGQIFKYRQDLRDKFRNVRRCNVLKGGKKL